MNEKVRPFQLASILPNMSLKYQLKPQLICFLDWCNCLK